MNYLKTIKNNLLMSAAGKGLIVGGIVGILFNIILMVSRYPGGMFTSVMMSLIPALIGAVVFGFFAFPKTGAISRRVASLEKISGRMQNDDIRSLGKDIAMGDTWLVLRQGKRYRFYTKDIITSLQLLSENPQAKQAVLLMEFRNGKSEKAIVTKSEALNAKIEEWMYTEENVNDLTLGQM